MEVSRIRALRGPNLWSRHTAIEAIISCSESERAISNIPGFEARLRERFPEIALLQPSVSSEIVSMAHALEYATLGLQAQAGCPVTFSRTAQTLESGIYQVIVEYSEEAVGRLALELAEQLCIAASDDTPFDLASALHRLREVDEDVRLGPSTGSIVYAAVARNIPYRRLTEGSMVQFGWGSNSAAFRLQKPTAPARSPNQSLRTNCSPSRCSTRPAFRCRSAVRLTTRKTPGPLPVKSKARWSSSRRTAIRAMG